VNFTDEFGRQETLDLLIAVHFAVLFIHFEDVAFVADGEVFVVDRAVGTECVFAAGHAT